MKSVERKLPHISVFWWRAKKKCCLLGTLFRWEKKSPVLAGENCPNGSGSVGGVSPGSESPESDLYLACRVCT